MGVAHIRGLLGVGGCDEELPLTGEGLLHHLCLKRRKKFQRKCERVSNCRRLFDYSVFKRFKIQNTRYYKKLQEKLQIRCIYKPSLTAGSWNVLGSCVQLTAHQNRLQHFWLKWNCQVGFRGRGTYVFLDVPADLLTEWQVLSQGAADDAVEGLHVCRHGWKRKKSHDCRCRHTRQGRSLC